jgi:general secretion pathway protein M
MQYLPDEKSARTTAILLLVVALILIYLLVFHWFIVRHMDYSDQISDQRAQLGRYEAVAAQHEATTEQLRRIRESRQDSDLFLDGADFNERIEERYEQVTVNVRMRCGALDFLQVLYQLESEVPMVIVDDLNIIRPRARRPSSSTATSTEALDIRFNMSAYLPTS